MVGRQVRTISRLGKRIVIGTDDELYIVIHSMIAGRLRWREGGKTIGGKLAQAAFEFDRGTLYLTEAGSEATRVDSRRAGRGRADAVRPWGAEVLDADLSDFASRLRSENHTLKRSLTDPRLFSGIGNAYSDEILHRARLSPILLTTHITDEEIVMLFEATKATLIEWTNRLRDESRRIPEKVTAFRPEMAVHGRYGEPCPICGTPVQRIRYATTRRTTAPVVRRGGCWRIGRCRDYSSRTGRSRSTKLSEGAGAISH